MAPSAVTPRAEMTPAQTPGAELRPNPTIRRKLTGVHWIDAVRVKNTVPVLAASINTIKHIPTLFCGLSIDSIVDFAVDSYLFCGLTDLSGNLVSGGGLLTHLWRACDPPCGGLSSACSCPGGFVASGLVSVILVIKQIHVVFDSHVQSDAG